MEEKREADQINELEFRTKQQIMMNKAEMRQNLQSHANTVQTQRMAAKERQRWDNQQDRQLADMSNQVH